MTQRLALQLARAAATYGPALLLLAGLVGFWELWVRLRDTPTYVLPAPSRVWQAFLDVRGTLPAHARVTIGEAVFGLFWAAFAGVGLAVLIASVPLARRVLYPLAVISQTIPLVVLAPLFIIWWGFGATPKVVTVALAGFFPIVVSTVEALLNADRDYVGLVRSAGANRLQILRYVLFPGALPAFFSGLKIAAAYAVLAAVIGEWVGAQSGLGIFITRSQASFRIDRVFVGVAVVALASMALFLAVHLLARVATPWVYAAHKEEHS